MTCWSTEEHLETLLGIVTEGCFLMSDRILFMSVEALKMSCAEAVDALAPTAGHFSP